MRLSSSLSILTCIISFLSILTPVAIIDDYAITWIDLHESPPLWILIAATFFVTAHDIKWLEGIKFIRKSDFRWLRFLLLVTAIVMSYALEISVNLELTSAPYWMISLMFKIPSSESLILQARIGYYLIRLCRLTLIFAAILSLIEPNPKKERMSITGKYTEIVEEEKKQTVFNLSDVQDIK